MSKGLVSTLPLLLIGCEVKDSELYAPLNVELKGKRNLVVLELVQSEQTYVRNLNILYTIFKIPMLVAVQTEELPLGEKHMQAIFGKCIEDIIKENSTFLTTLVERVRENDLGIGAILGLIPFLKYYQEYSLAYHKANSLRIDLLEKKRKNKILARNTSGESSVSKSHI